MKQESGKNNVFQSASLCKTILRAFKRRPFVYNRDFRKRLLPLAPVIGNGHVLSSAETQDYISPKEIMSDAHNEHESLIKTPQQLIAAVLAGFLIPIIVIVLLVQYVGGSPKTGAGSNAQSPEAIAARIKPVADEGYTLVDTGTAAAPAAAPAQAAAEAAPAVSAPAAPAATAAPAKLAADTGKKTYEAACVACHGAGIAGAPKFGDKAAWAPRIKQGKDVLYTHAIKGYMGKAGMMPAKGGSNASDEEVKAAVDYMVAAGK